METQQTQKKKSTPNKKKHKWLKRLVVLSVVITTLLTLLPVGLELGGEKWLQDNGVPQADIGDIDLNLFTGKLSIERQGDRAH